MMTTVPIRCFAIVLQSSTGSGIRIEWIIADVDVGSLVAEHTQMVQCIP